MSGGFDSRYPLTNPDRVGDECHVATQWLYVADYHPNLDKIHQTVYFIISIMKWPPSSTAHG